MIKAKPTSILFDTKDQEVVITLDVDPTFAGKMLEALDSIPEQQHGSRIVVSGERWRVTFEMDTQVTEIFRDAMKDSIISNIPLPEILESKPSAASKVKPK